MLEDKLNSSKKEISKRDIIIEYDKDRTDYADMLKSIISICNDSDASEFNKKIHINRYDEIKVRDNKNQISENIYEIVIGLPDEMDWCEEVSSYHGLHFCMEGKTAHVYVDEIHYSKSEIKEFEKYATNVEAEFKIRKTKRSEKGMGSCAMMFWNPSTGDKSFKEQFNKKALDRYLDVPWLFHWIGRNVRSGVRWAVRAIGLGRQNDLRKRKYKILIKDFYLHYLPMLIGEADAR